MEIEVKSQTDDEIVFIVRDAEVPFINAIRRCAMVNVPKIAIEDVNIMRNDSAMFNEVLAHRLGLTPLVSNMDAIEGLPLPGDDDYEENNSVMFSLKEEGPKVVYSKDLISSDSKIKPVYDTIPLVKLKEGEKLNIEAVAKVGYGKEHAKWMPTTVCVYKQYPEITTEYMFVDNAAMQLIQWPNRFDVIVTENMFGDILTDEASVITGSLGMLPSASIGIHTSVFEPIHGSYPQAAGKNIANPVATILSAALMFEYAFNLMDEGKMIREAVDASIEAGIVTEDLAQNGKSYKTSEVGQWIADYIKNK